MYITLSYWLVARKQIREQTVHQKDWHANAYKSWHDTHAKKHCTLADRSEHKHHHDTHVQQQRPYWSKLQTRNPSNTWLLGRPDNSEKREWLIGTQHWTHVVKFEHICVSLNGWRLDGINVKWQLYLIQSTACSSTKLRIHTAQTVMRMQQAEHNIHK